MPHAQIENGKIAVATEYRDREAIKQVPGFTWDGTGQWRGPLSWASCKALRGVFGDRLTIGDDLKQWAWEEKTGRIDPSLNLREALDAAGDERLFPPQRAGVAWLRATKRGLLGDPMGTGKTRQLLLAIPDDGWPAIVICPNSVRGSWKKEVESIGLDVEVRVLDGTAAKRKKDLQGIEDGDRVLVVTNWESVRTLSRLAPYGSIRLRKCVEHGGEDEKVTESKCEVHRKPLNEVPWRTVIRDEAHRAKDPSSKQTRASWAVQHSDTVRYCWDATGTPVAQNIGDLWTIMHGNSPQDFSGKSKFIDRYAVTSWNIYGSLDIAGLNPLNSEELFEFLDPRFRHIPKEALLPFLPEKVREERVCKMNRKQETAYREMAETMIALLEEGAVVTTNPLAQYTRLIQFSSAYAEIDEEGEVRLSEPSCKVDELIDIANDLGDEPFAVGMVSRQLLELCEQRLEKEGISYASIKGGQSMADRDQAIDDFQNGRVRVILLTVQSGGVGITLTRAAYLVMLQRSWSLVDNLQTEDRVHRIGSEQHKQVTIIDVVTDGTIEVGRQLERLQEKGANLSEILRDADVLKRLVNGETVDLVTAKN
jgi:SNF2 family DNA or RNA helicase